MKPHLGVAGLALMAATLVACGSGGASPFIGPPATSAPVPSYASATIPLSTSATTPISLSAISNVSSATMTFPIVSAMSDATVTLQTSLPSGASQPQARSLGKAPSAIGGSNVDVLDYITVSLDASVIISQTPSFSFTMASPVSGNAYIAMFDTNNAKSGWTVILGPGSASGNTISFAAQTLVPSLSLQAKDTYVFALFTASGIATPTPVPAYPGASGSSFTFSGSQTQTDAYNYPTPSPLPSTSVTSTVTEAVTVGASPFPSGTPATTDLHEVLTQAGPLASNVTTTDAWYGLVTGAARGIALYGTSSSDNNSDTFSTMYTTPNTIDYLPETNGKTWSNSIAGTTAASFSDGQTLARTDNPDGSFSETTTVNTLSHHYTFVLAGNADDSGSYTGTAISALGLASINASAPVNGTITISFAPTSGSPFTMATPAAWFKPNTPLYSETDKQSLNVTYPSSCSVPASFGFIGTHVAQTIDRIDPMIGTDEHETVDTYSGPLGPVCMLMTDKLIENYDYLLDTATSYSDIADFSGNAVHVQSITQTLTLQNATMKSSSAKAQSATTALSPAAVSAARAQFGLKVANARHQLVARTIKRIETVIQHGGIIK